MAGNLGQLGMVAMGLVGLISVVRSRRAGRRDDPAADEHLAARMEMERRMGSYLASRETAKSERNER